jgi:hypothetical protein
MRAATVQEAAQILMALFMIPFVALQMVALLLRDLLTRLLRGLDGRQFLLVVLAATTALAISVVAVAIVRFRRPRLVKK